MQGIIGIKYVELRCLGEVSCGTYRDESSVAGSDSRKTYLKCTQK